MCERAREREEDGRDGRDGREKMGLVKWSVDGWIYRYMNRSNLAVIDNDNNKFIHPCDIG